MIWFPRFLSFSTGFLSLSQEILWIRLASFAYKGVPHVFAFTLGMYLLGIMLGAAVGKLYCRRDGDLVAISGWILALAAVADAVLPWLFVLSLRGGWLAGLVVLSVALVATAAFKSAVFPIAHHLGSSRRRGEVGSSVSKVYFSNIIGSTLGPLVTGFVLLDIVSLQQSLALMVAGTLLVSMSCFLVVGARRAALAAAAALALIVAVLPIAPGQLVTQAALATSRYRGPITALIENRHGIIHLQAREGSDTETVFGGNAYDGTFNTDPIVDDNLITRMYVSIALHPGPKRALMIGLSGGAWTRALLAVPGLERVDVVEINSGYLKLLDERPRLPELLNDARVVIHVDDGRRWLKRHPDERFDLIIMNTTFHWRAYASLLLGEDFVRLARSHLNVGGIFAFNGTGSADAFKTAASVFPHVFRHRSFVIASDADLAAQQPYLRERLAGFNWSGMPLFRTGDQKVESKLDSMIAELARFDEDEMSRQVARPLRVITEKNMISEYRYGAYYQGLFARGWP